MVTAAGSVTADWEHSRKAHEDALRLDAVVGASERDAPVAEWRGAGLAGQPLLKLLTRFLRHVSPSPSHDQVARIPRIAVPSHRGVRYRGH